MVGLYYKRREQRSQHKFLRLVNKCVISLFALVIVGFVFVVFFFNGERIKRPLSAYLSSVLGADVSIGNADFSPIYPDVMRLTDVRFGNSKINELYVEYDILSALSKEELQLNDLYINGLTLNDQDLTKLTSSKLGYQSIHAEVLRLNHIPLHLLNLSSEDLNLRLVDARYNQDGLTFRQGRLTALDAELFGEKVTNLGLEFKHADQGFLLSNLSVNLMGGTLSGTGMFYPTNLDELLASAPQNAARYAPDSTADAPQDKAQPSLQSDTLGTLSPKKHTNKNQSASNLAASDQTTQVSSGSTQAAGSLKGATGCSTLGTTMRSHDEVITVGSFDNKPCDYLTGLIKLQPSAGHIDFDELYLTKIILPECLSVPGNIAITAQKAYLSDVIVTNQSQTLINNGSSMLLKSIKATSSKNTLVNESTPIDQTIGKDATADATTADTSERQENFTNTASKAAATNTYNPNKDSAAPSDAALAHKADNKYPTDAAYNTFVMQGINGQMTELKLDQGHLLGLFKGDIGELSLPNLQTVFEHNKANIRFVDSGFSFELQGNVYEGDYRVRGKYNRDQTLLSVDDLRLNHNKLELTKERWDYLQHGLTTYQVKLGSLSFSELEFLSYINSFPVSIQSISGNAADWQFNNPQRKQAARMTLSEDEIKAVSKLNNPSDTTAFAANEQATLNANDFNSLNGTNELNGTNLMSGTNVINGINGDTFADGLELSDNNALSENRMYGGMLATPSALSLSNARKGKLRFNIEGDPAALLNLELTNVLYSDLRMRKAQCIVTLSDDIINISIPKLQFNESSLSAQATLGLVESQASSYFMVNANDFEIADLNSNLINHLLTGKVDLKVDLSSHHNSLEQIWSNLEGQITVTSDAMLISDLGLDLINGGAKKNYELSGTELMTGIQGSVAGINNLKLDVDFANHEAKVKGSMDLATGSTNFNGKLELATNTASGQAFLTSLAQDSSTQVLMSGTLAEPKFKIIALKRGEARPGLYLPQYEGSAIAKEPTDTTLNPIAPLKDTKTQSQTTKAQTDSTTTSATEKDKAKTDSTNTTDTADTTTDTQESAQKQAYQDKSPDSANTKTKAPTAAPIQTTDTTANTKVAPETDSNVDNAASALDTAQTDSATAEAKTDPAQGNAQTAVPQASTTNHEPSTDVTNSTPTGAGSDSESNTDAAPNTVDPAQASASNSDLGSAPDSTSATTQTADAANMAHAGDATNQNVATDVAVATNAENSSKVNAATFEQSETDKITDKTPLEQTVATSKIPADSDLNKSADVNASANINENTNAAANQSESKGEAKDAADVKAQDQVKDEVKPENAKTDDTAQANAEPKTVPETQAKSEATEKAEPAKTSETKVEAPAQLESTNKGPSAPLEAKVQDSSSNATSKQDENVTQAPSQAHASTVDAPTKPSTQVELKPSDSVALALPTLNKDHQQEQAQATTKLKQAPAKPEQSDAKLKQQADALEQNLLEQAAFDSFFNFQDLEAEDQERKDTAQAQKEEFKFNNEDDEMIF